MAQPVQSSCTDRSDLPGEKETRLRALMRSMGRVLVAYSGGVDSSYLAAVATQELGDRALCVLGVSASVAAVQRERAVSTAEEFGFNLLVLETEELGDFNYSSNPTNRCYFCKSELYTKLREVAEGEKITFLLDGTNADDLGDYRPGRAAAGERGVTSPLADVGMTKTEIRLSSKALGLPTWDLPASPCLSSRISYGTPVTVDTLSRIERGENVLRELGFREFRVRVHDDLARVEIARGELSKALEEGFAAKVSEELRKIGFKFVTLDLEGFRSGSLNG